MKDTAEFAYLGKINRSDLIYFIHKILFDQTFVKSVNNRYINDSESKPKVNHCTFL